MCIDYENILDKLEKELKNILNYWINYTVDVDNGGFVGLVDKNNNVINNANKGIILNSRILWAFSAAYNYFKQDEYILCAHRAYDYLKNYFFDNVYGGVYWLLDYKGNPLNKRKQIYAQAFVLYALSEYYKIFNNENIINYALEIYNLIEKYAKDNNFGGYIEAFKEDWSEIEDYRLSDKDENLPKSMNTHLHILEAYTNLYKIWPDKKLKKNIIDLIEIFTRKIFNRKTSHLGLFFELDWKPASNKISYGHDIEASWLIYEAANIVGDEELINKVRNFSIQLAKSTLEAIDGYGGIIYECDLDKYYFNNDKHWWPQAEALVGFLNAYEITGNSEWLVKFYYMWNYIEMYIIDKQYGEWYWRVDQNNRPYDESKVDFWKCPYHNTRACIESINRLKKIKDYEK